VDAEIDGGRALGGQGAKPVSLVGNLIGIQRLPLGKEKLLERILRLRGQVQLRRVQILQHDKEHVAVPIPRRRHQPVFLHELAQQAFEMIFLQQVAVVHVPPASPAAQTFVSLTAQILYSGQPVPASRAATVRKLMGASLK